MKKIRDREGRQMDVKEAKQVREVLNANPDLPIMLLTPSTDSYDGYNSYYHKGIEAEVQNILRPWEVNKKTGSYWGLSDEKYYTDEDDAVEDVSEWLFYAWNDDARANGHVPQFQHVQDLDEDEAMTTFCGYRYDYSNDVSIELMAENLARHIVEDMPWQKYVVIRAAL